MGGLKAGISDNKEGGAIAHAGGQDWKRMQRRGLGDLYGICSQKPEELAGVVEPKGMRGHG